MPNFLSKLILSMCIFIHCKAQSQHEFKPRTFSSKSGQELPYRILFPSNYNSSKKYPLVLFLHGSGERGTDNKKQLTHGGELFLKNINKFPAIVVFPQCPSDSYWTSLKVDESVNPHAIRFEYKDKPTWPMQATVELVIQLRNTEKVDPTRVYVMGVSLGGMGTFELISRYPELFAAAVPICGGGNTQFAKKFARQVPLWLFHGAQDDVVNPAYSREMYQTLKSLGAKVTYTEYPGVKHNSWNKALAEPQLLPWMFSQQKK